MRDSRLFTRLTGLTYINKGAKFSETRIQKNWELSILLAAKEKSRTREAPIAGQSIPAKAWQLYN